MSRHNLRRRGAAYWWRRLLTLPGLAGFEKLPISLEFSLFTKELDTARGRSAALTAHSERLRMNFRDLVATSGLSADDQAKIFVEEMRSYRNELVHLSSAWKAVPAFQQVNDQDRDLRVYVSLWQALAKDGISRERDWSFVEEHFANLDAETQARVRSLLRDHPKLGNALKADATKYLEREGIFPNEISLAAAVDLIVRARAQAAQRLQAGCDNSGLADAAALRVHDDSITRNAASVQASSISAAPAPATAPTPLPAAMPSFPAAVVPRGIVISPTTLAGGADSLLDKSPLAMADLFIDYKFGGKAHRSGRKRPAKSVGEPTERDIRWAMLLVTQVIGVDRPFSTFSQQDLLSVDAWFDHIPITYGKSPSHRRPDVDLQQIADEALQKVHDGDLQAEDIGLSGATTNKHMHNIRRVHEFMRATHVDLQQISINNLVVPDLKGERDAREKLPLDVARQIFQLPPWTGCVNENERLKKGDAIYHDALFYVLPLVWYTGARREEICKLMIDDVKLGEIPHVHISPTVTGRLKNFNAKRDVPLHDELIRLGFLQYVDAMRAAGETLLFPELYPAGNTKRSLGDVFYKLWWIYLRQMVTGLARGQAFHSVRHSVADALRQAGFSEEDRNDFLGHSQSERSENTKRYSDPINLAMKKKMTESLFVATRHLPDVTAITLLPQEMRVGRPSRNGPA